MSVKGHIFPIVSLYSIEWTIFLLNWRAFVISLICLSRSSQKSLLVTELSTAHNVLNSLVRSGLRKWQRHCDKSANAICIIVRVSLAKAKWFLHLLFSFRFYLRLFSWGNPLYLTMDIKLCEQVSVNFVRSLVCYLRPNEVQMFTLGTCKFSKLLGL